MVNSNSKNDNSTYHRHSLEHGHGHGSGTTYMSSDIIKTGKGDYEDDIDETDIPIIAKMNQVSDNERKYQKKRGITILIILMFLLALLLLTFRFGIQFLSFIFFFIIVIIPIVLLFDKQVTQIIYPLFEIKNKYIEDEPEENKYDENTFHGKFRNRLSRKAQDIMTIILISLLILVSVYIFVKSSSEINILIGGFVLSLAGALNTYGLSNNFEPDFAGSNPVSGDNHTHSIGPIKTSSPRIQIE